MAQVRDLRGQRFGRLRVLARAQYVVRDGKACWPVVCDCGAKLAEVRGTKLTHGEIVSCGCAKADPHVRRAARWVTPARRRREIAQMGAAARHGTP